MLFYILLFAVNSLRILCFVLNAGTYPAVRVQWPLWILRLPTPETMRVCMAAQMSALTGNISPEYVLQRDQNAKTSLMDITIKKIIIPPNAESLGWGEPKLLRWNTHDRYLSVLLLWEPCWEDFVTACLTPAGSEGGPGRVRVGGEGWGGGGLGLATRIGVLS